MPLATLAISMLLAAVVGAILGALITPALQPNITDPKVVRRRKIIGGTSLAVLFSIIATAFQLLANSPAPTGQVTERQLPPQVTVVVTYPPTQPPVVITAPPAVVTAPPNVITVPPVPTTTEQQNCAHVEDILAEAWIQVQNRIGCPLEQPIYGQVVVEDFERGKMLWRQPIDLGTDSEGYALVLLYAGTWKRYNHAPYNGSGGTSCAEAQNGIPAGGFGMMWCDIPEIRQSLGNAVTAQKDYQNGNVMRNFDRGFMVYTADGATYIFYQDDTWERR
jgi:hypothetical protein